MGRNHPTGQAEHWHGMEQAKTPSQQCGGPLGPWSSLSLPLRQRVELIGLEVPSLIESFNIMVLTGGPFHKEKSLGPRHSEVQEAWGRDLLLLGQLQGVSFFFF